MAAIPLEISRKGLAYKLWTPDGSQGHPVIVVLHGLLGSHKNFVSFGARFAQHGYAVLGFDARNHGASLHSPALDYPTMAADLEELLSELDYSRVVVLGHSLGGRTAMIHALLYPQRVAALVIVDVTPQHTDPGIGKIVAAMAATEPRLPAAANRSQVERLLQTQLCARDADSEGVRQFLLLCNLETDSQHENKGYRWRCNLGAIAQNLEQLVHWPAQWLQQHSHTASSVPLLLIAGGRSPYVQQPGWEQLLRYFPDSAASPTVMRTIAEAHHWPHTQTPQPFQQLVAEFLAAHSIGCDP